MNGELGVYETQQRERASRVNCKRGVDKERRMPALSGDHPLVMSDLLIRVVFP